MNHFLDLTKRLTDKRLGMPESERVRFIVWVNYEDSGIKRDVVDDIIEGTRKYMIKYFNNYREGWIERKCDVKVEPIVESKH